MPSLFKAFPLILAASVLANPLALHGQDAPCECETSPNRTVIFDSAVELWMEMSSVAMTQSADRQYEKGLLLCAAKSDLALKVFSAIERKLEGGSDQPNATATDTPSLGEIVAHIVELVQKQHLTHQVFIDVFRDVLSAIGLSTDRLPVSASQGMPPASAQRGVSGVLSGGLECIECEKGKVTSGQLAGGRNKTKPQPFGSGGNGQRTGGASRTKSQPFGNSTSGHGGQRGSVRNGSQPGRGSGRNASGGNQRAGGSGGSSTSRTGGDRNRQSNGGGRAAQSQGGKQRVQVGVDIEASQRTKNPGTAKNGLASGNGGSRAGSSGGRAGNLVSGGNSTRAGGSKVLDFTAHLGEDGSPTGGTSKGAAGRSGGRADSGRGSGAGTKAGGNQKDLDFTVTTHVGEDGSRVPSSGNTATGGSSRGMGGSGGRKGGNGQNPHVKGDSQRQSTPSSSGTKGDGHSGRTGDGDSQPSKTVWGAVLNIMFRPPSDAANFDGGEDRSFLTVGDKNQGDEVRVGEKDLKGKTPVNAQVNAQPSNIRARNLVEGQV